MEWTWLWLFIILLIIESLTFNLVTIWFAIGSIGAFITTYFTHDFSIQCISFIIISIVALILTRPMVKRLSKNNKNIKTNLDLVIGAFGIATSDIKNDSIGRVKVLGKDWAAISNDEIKTGEQVEVLNIQGVKLNVKKKEGCK